MSGESDIGGGAARTRLAWLDALKGVGIVAVVAGHVWWRGPLRDAVYVFHMPLFFMVSGYTAHVMPWRTLLPRLGRSLLLPFLCFAALLLAADFAIEGWRGVRPIFASWIDGAATILLATETLRGPFTILWFIPGLLLARLAWNALMGPGREPMDRMVLAGMMLVAALALLVHYEGGRSPFAILAVPAALLMIWAGALWRSLGRPRPMIALLLAPFAAAALIWFRPVNMKLGDLGWPGLSLAGAVAITVVLAMLLRRAPALLVSGAASLGRASLVIMYVHVAVVHYLAPYLPQAALFLAALAGSWALDWLIRRTRVTRLLLRGEAWAPRPAADRDGAKPLLR